MQSLIVSTLRTLASRSTSVIASSFAAPAAGPRVDVRAAPGREWQETRDYSAADCSGQPREGQGRRRGRLVARLSEPERGEYDVGERRARPAENPQWAGELTGAAEMG